MTEQNIPAEKVRELKAKYEYDTSGNPERLLDDLLHDLDALLPVQQPATGLLGRWAKHEEYGDVLITSDRVTENGRVCIVWKDGSGKDGAEEELTDVDSLTFPEQTTKPEEVPAGEAWLVDVDGEKYNAIKTTDRFPWWFFNPEINTHYGWGNSAITLIAPLTPERPVSDLQAKSTERALDRMKAKYDELEWEYKQAQAEITWLKAGNTPRIVATPERPGKDDLLWKYAILQQDYAHLEEECSDLQTRYDALDAKYREAQEKIKTLEQPSPVWRIEHDWRNLRGDEYIIDKNGDPVVTETKHWAGEPWYTDSLASVVPEYARFIVFPNKDAATPEAIEEAMKERDKERE